MPSLRSKQRLKQCIFLGVSTLFLSSALIGCGSGESEAKIDNTPIVSVPKPKDFDIKVPVEMRNVVIKIYDNFDNSLIMEQKLSTTTNAKLTLPKVLTRSHLHRIEITATPDSLIYDFLTGRYQSFNSTLHALVNVDVSNPTQIIFVNPSSEAIYQRALIRSGYLPNEIKDPKNISSLHLNLATFDVNSALVNAYTYLDLPNLEPLYQLSNLSSEDVNIRPSTYTNAFFSYGYIQQWAIHYSQNAFEDFTRNLAIDLGDGYLDAKVIRGEKAPLISLMNISPENIDPNKNNAKDIADNQVTNRTQFAESLKESVLLLARNHRQDILNPNGYKLLKEHTYMGIEPINNSILNIRTAGAGDYRRAVGFVDTTATCNGSIYPCKQGLTGINIINPNLPSIEYLIGHYQDTVNNCQLNIRANGTLELIKGSQIYRSVLDADSTDNLLQVDKANNQYILNSSSTEPNNATLQYTFVQVQIKSNQVMSASAGLDSRKAPDQLQTTQLECSFS
ncbi:hypothetical protein [Acinetobacter beijerinckii]|uniref:hypothetical protein n=1 Tax=Acinetobacter beijerinckii TaxID=262668 RepID=UPI0040552898